MIAMTQADRETRIADILLKSETALNEVHQYYKFGRHEGKFPEKSYFLLSHCAHLLFSLWLTDKESSPSLFDYSSRLRAVLAGADLCVLQYSDYKRRTLHADAYQEHLHNEPLWFKYWLKALETQDGPGSLNYQEFSQTILTYVSRPGFLEGNITEKERRVLADLMRGDAVAKVLCRSITLLEEMCTAVVCYFMDLDQSNHTTEQLLSLICMLRQARRIIISETPAQGPYVLLANKNWGIPSNLFRIYAGRMRGLLKVVPKRDGGSIICTYARPSAVQTKKRSWTREGSILTAHYEEELFKTWSYETGHLLCSLEPSTDGKAYWLVQSTEIKRLRTVFRKIDATLKAMSKNPMCGGLVAAFAPASIDNPSNWEGSKLLWTYIKKLDQLLNKLRLAYREAKVLGGHNPGEQIIANMWPPAAGASKQAEALAGNKSAVPKPVEELAPSAESPQTDPALSEDPTPVGDCSTQLDHTESEQIPGFDPAASELDRETEPTGPIQAKKQSL